MIRKNMRIRLRILGSALIVFPFVLGSYGMYIQDFKYWGLWLAGISAGIVICLFIVWDIFPVDRFLPYKNKLPIISGISLVVAIGTFFLYFLPIWVGFIGGLSGMLACSLIVIKRKLSNQSITVYEGN